MLIFFQSKGLVRTKAIYTTCYLHASKHYFCLYWHSKILILCFTIVSTTQSSLAEFFILVIMLWCMDLNASSISESSAVSLVLEWKILWSFLFWYSKTNIDWTLNFFDALNNPFNLFFIMGLALISCNSGSKNSKSWYYSDICNYQKNLIASSQHIFLLPQVLLERYKALQQFF